MTEILTAILVAFGLLIGLPILAYLVAKFTTAGYFRAKTLLQPRPPSPPGSEAKETRTEPENETR